MLLFAFSLVLAGAAVAVAAFMGIGAGELQQMLMLSVAAVLGGAGFIGLIVALIDVRHTKKREARLQALRDAPSGLQWKPAVEAPSAQVPEASEVAAAPVVAAPVEVVEAPAPTATVDESQEAALVDVAPTPPVEVPVVEETPVAEEVTARAPADQLLHLDPEFELSEIKRVLRIWQMTFNEEQAFDQLASWSAADGTQIDLLKTERGYPILEIRGPMASELAEFLPQDLPVHPMAIE